MTADRRCAARSAHFSRLRLGGQGGYSLVEVLVAFSIAALSLVALLQALGGNLNRAATIEEYATANGLARSMLARIGRDIALTSERVRGRFDQRYRWTRVVRPHATATGPLLSYDVEVTVSWQSAGERRSITLQTVRLAPHGNS